MGKTKRSSLGLGRRSGIWLLDLLCVDVLLRFNGKFQESSYVLEGPAGDAKVLWDG